MDMLVNLYNLPEQNKVEVAELQNNGYVFRNAIAPEKHIIVNWVAENFNKYWANEVEASFNNFPVSCIVVQQNGVIKGFACYEATAKTFFGPTGVLESERKKGLGKVLLIDALLGLKNMGYAYGIIGGIGPQAFYEKVVGATVIENSTPGIYKNMIKI
ncbi:MAG: hypothetical protein KAG96_06235 [Ichthyobacteriaceae bacterium]|nr:hypothetical protein [Ichthyobacteriaceae bacterium]